MPKYRLLTVDGNPKVVKGEKKGWLTGILHLAPSVVSVEHGGFNTCAWSDGCERVCLNTAGRGGIPDRRAGEGFANIVQRARVRRTLAFLTDRSNFLINLCQDIDDLRDEAEQRGLKPAVRLNGTSDLLWDRIQFAGLGSVIENFPKMQFYDYTKRPIELIKNLPKNYHLTLSRGAGWDPVYVRYVVRERGLNVAIVYDTKKGEPLPSAYCGVRVIDGDLHDLRFLDPKGVVVGLRAKGKARGGDADGFVVEGGKIWKVKR